MLDITFKLSYENVIIFNRIFPEQSLTALFINGIFRIDCANVWYLNGIYM